MGQSLGVVYYYRFAVKVSRKRRLLKLIIELRRIDSGYVIPLVCDKLT